MIPISLKIQVSEEDIKRQYITPALDLNANNLIAIIKPKDNKYSISYGL